MVEPTHYTQRSVSAGELCVYTQFCIINQTLSFSPSFSSHPSNHLFPPTEPLHATSSGSTTFSSDNNHYLCQVPFILLAFIRPILSIHLSMPPNPGPKKPSNQVRADDYRSSDLEEWVCPNPTDTMILSAADDYIAIIILFVQRTSDISSRAIWYILRRGTRLDCFLLQWNSSTHIPWHYSKSRKHPS